MSDTTITRGGTSAATAATETAGIPTGRKLWWLLVVIAAGQMMSLLDATIVNVAVPTISHDLHASGSRLQLIVAGYTIVYAVLLITGARLGDRLGTGRIFRAGLVWFTLASLACGIAPNSGLLIAFRGLQGAGAALMVPQVLSIIQRDFPGNARARALSVYAAIMSLGVVLGQVLGGVLVSANIFNSGWRPAFLVNVPIGIILLLVSPKLLPNGRPNPERKLDPPGVATLVPAVLAFVVPLVLGHELNWPAWTWISLGAALFLVVGFIQVERTVAKRGGSPLVSGRVIRAPGLAAGLVAISLGMAAYAGYLFAFALHLQSGLGNSALRAGLVAVPSALGFAIASLNWRRVPNPVRQWLIPLGFALAGLTYLGVAGTLRTGHEPQPALGIVLFLLGLGYGAAFSPLITTALAKVPLHDASDASGVITTMMMIGQVTGVATLGTLFLTLVGQHHAHPSNHAIAVTGLVIGGVTIAAALSSIVLVRNTR